MGDAHSDGNRADGEDPMHAVELNGLSVDATTVTVADYRCDIDNPVDPLRPKAIIATNWQVPTEVRARSRSKKVEAPRKSEPDNRSHPLRESDDDEEC